MGINVCWGDDQHTIIHIAYGLEWTWKDFNEADEVARVMLDTIPHKAHFVLDLEYSRLPAGTIGQLPKLASSTTGVTHPNAGGIVIVGADQHLQTIWNLFKKLYPAVAARVITCDTVADAYAMLGATVPSSLARNMD